MHTAAFPPARGRSPGPNRPGTVEKYERFQTFAQRDTTDTTTELGTFSGKPDSIYLACAGNHAIFTLTDRTRRELEEIAIPLGTAVETHISAEVVLVRSFTPGQVAKVTATGKWAEPAESTRGYLGG